jgi:hypothetical protein
MGPHISRIVMSRPKCIECPLQPVLQGAAQLARLQLRYFGGAKWHTYLCEPMPQLHRMTQPQHALTVGDRGHLWQFVSIVGPLQLDRQLQYSALHASHGAKIPRYWAVGKHPLRSVFPWALSLWWPYYY